MKSTPLKFNWKIEYEIPPLRAIYYCMVEDCTEEEARSAFATQQPMWRIRKLTSFLQIPE
jgi:hypothetical protein